MVVLIFLIIDILLTGVLGYGLWLSERKNTQYEGWTLDAQDRIEGALVKMRQIDASGAFEAEDDVGDVFKALTTAVEELRILTYTE